MKIPPVRRPLYRSLGADRSSRPSSIRCQSEARRTGVQLAFALMYTVIALTVLLSAV
jgi:nitrogen fixation/metabolism regulation signal transduction histidine kinase